jgi:hypothetical protein
MPLINKGIFKEKVEVSLVYCDKLAAKAVMNYKSEEVFFKIVSVFQKAFIKFN